MYFDGSKVEDKYSYKYFVLSSTWTRHWITFKTPTSWNNGSNGFRIGIIVYMKNINNSLDKVQGIEWPNLNFPRVISTEENKDNTAVELKDNIINYKTYVSSMVTLP